MERGREFVQLMLELAAGLVEAGVPNSTPSLTT